MAGFSQIVVLLPWIFLSAVGMRGRFRLLGVGGGSAGGRPLLLDGGPHMLALARAGLAGWLGIKLLLVVDCPVRYGSKDDYRRASEIAARRCRTRRPSAGMRTKSPPGIIICR